MHSDFRSSLPEWTTWIEQIAHELTTLDSHDKLVGELKEIIEANPELMKENPLSEWMEWVHAADMAIRIRRQVDADGNARSLRRLLEKLKPYQAELLQERINTRPAGVSEKSMRTALRGEGTDKLDIGADILALVVKTKSIVCYADRVVAHADKRGMPGALAWVKVHASAEVVISMAERYYLLVTGNGNGIRIQGPLNVRCFFLAPWVIPDTGSTNSL